MPSSLPIHYQTLRYYDKDALMMGGKVLEWVQPQYLYYRATGNTAKAQKIKDSCEQVEDQLVRVYYTVGGFGNSLANNLSLGAIPRSRVLNLDFVRGQQAGDVASLFWGAGEIFMGQNMASQGGLGLVLSGGLILPVAGPMVLEGAALTVHGSAVISKAGFELSINQHQRNIEGQKGGGRNEPHANPDTKSTARDEYERAKAALAKYKAESSGNPGRQKEIKRLENQVKHWKKQADFTGETHSRTAKGKKGN